MASARASAIVAHQQGSAARHSPHNTACKLAATGLKLYRRCLCSHNPLLEELSHSGGQDSKQPTATDYGGLFCSNPLSGGSPRRQHSVPGRLPDVRSQLSCPSPSGDTATSTPGGACPTQLAAGPRSVLPEGAAGEPRPVALWWWWAGGVQRKVMEEQASVMP